MSSNRLDLEGPCDCQPRDVHHMDILRDNESCTCFICSRNEGNMLVFGSCENVYNLGLFGHIPYSGLFSRGKISAN